MGRARFPLTSDQLELLLAFEEATSAAQLAELVRRDPSVVSRNLQRLADDAPVLVKQSGRWQITPLGRRLNELTRQYLGTLAEALPKTAAAPASAPLRSAHAVLLVINAQMALLDPARGPRSNPHAERNAARILAHWRATGRRVIHVRHTSTSPASAFHPESGTAAFLPALAPQSGETVLAKGAASAFSGTTLLEELTAAPLDALVLAGFTANECIDATAKQASDLGLPTFVAGDATAMFDVVGPDGTVFKATRTQEMLLASLSEGFATIVTTDELLA